MMTYAELAAELGKLTVPFREGAWVGQNTDHGTYDVDDRIDLIADTTHAEKLLEGTVDLFVRGTRGDADAAAVETAMDTAGVHWEAPDILYEDRTGFTHWSWVFRCIP